MTAQRDGVFDDNGLLQWRRGEDARVWMVESGHIWDFYWQRTKLPLPPLHSADCPRGQNGHLATIFFFKSLLKFIQSCWCPSFHARDFWSPWRLLSDLKIFLSFYFNFLLLTLYFYFVPKWHKKLFFCGRNMYFNKKNSGCYSTQA